MSALFASKSGLHQYLHGSLRRFRKELASSGSLSECTTSGRVGGVTYSTACDSGGKEGNQDYVAMLAPRKPYALSWALAVADGVSSSYESDWASQLACITALLALNRHYRQKKPKQYPPVATCLAHFRRLGELIETQADSCRPLRFTKFGWKFALREGHYLQSTLTVAWEDAYGIHVEGIGDGGFILQTEQGNPPIAHLPASDKPVRCLGPKNTQRGADYHYSVAKWNSLCLFTDGLTRLVPRWFPKLEDAHARRLSGTSKGAASLVLEETMKTDRDELDDNITLASVRKEVA